MGEPQLAMMVADTAEEMPHPSAQFKVLLAVITYSYATGIYPSAEIESSLRQSRHPFACPDEEWEHAIRSYRRMHHAKIERSLAEVLRRCFCYYNGEREIHPPGPDHFGEEPLTREAVARVARAIRFDSSALDF